MKIAANQPRNPTAKWPTSSESVNPARLVTKKKLIVPMHAQTAPARIPNLTARATRSDMYVSSPTFNDLPKTSLIWRASVRLPEMPRKIMTVCRAVRDCVLIRLRAEDQVFVFSRGETPHDATVSDFPDIGVRVSLSNRRRSV